MYNSWAEVSRQLEEELQSERAQRQARRAQQRFSWPSLRWWQRLSHAQSITPHMAPAGGRAGHSPRGV